MIIASSVLLFSLLVYFIVLPLFKSQIEKQLIDVISGNIVDQYMKDCEIHFENNVHNNVTTIPETCVRVQVIKEYERVNGERGDRGPRGPEGDHGHTGEQGEVGERGPEGDKGDKGDTGPKGDKGDTGATGPKGDKGDKGATGATGPEGPIGPSGPAGTLSLTYGSFFDTTNQTNPTPNVARAVKYDSTAEADGVSIVGGSKIKITKTGVYNIQFSIQVYKTDTGADTVDFWLVKNTNLVPDTNTRLTLIDRFYYNVAAWNYVISANQNDELELYWSSPDSSASLRTEGPFTGPTRPRIPSVILTVTQLK